MFWEDNTDPDYVQNYLDNPVAMYVRVRVSDEEAEGIYGLFGSVNWLACDEAEEGELAFVTPKMAEREIRGKLAQLEEQGAEIKTTIRIADF